MRLKRLNSKLSQAPMYYDQRYAMGDTEWATPSGRHRPIGANFRSRRQYGATLRSGSITLRAQLPIFRWP